MGNFIGTIKAILTRVIFATHGFVAIYKVVSLKQNLWYWYLSLTILLLSFEGVFTLAIKKSQEWKWFCPSVFLYLASVCPSIWLIELEKLETRIIKKEYMKEGIATTAPVLTTTTTVPMSSTTLNMLPVNFNNTDVLKEVGIPINLDNIPVDADTLVVIIEQFLMLILIIGRWMLPKGDLTRDELSQLLLVYIGTAADIIEFFDSFKDEKVNTNRVLCILVLSIWSWSLMQFTIIMSSPKNKSPFVLNKKKTKSEWLKEICCSVDVWSILITIILQDAPFFVFRLLLITYYKLISYMNIFFTCKNTLVIVLQFYRLMIVQLDKRAELKKEEEKARKLAASKARLSYIESRNNKSSNSSSSKSSKSSKSKSKKSKLYDSSRSNTIDGSKPLSRSRRGRRPTLERHFHVGSTDDLELGQLINTHQSTRKPKKSFKNAASTVAAVIEVPQTIGDAKNKYSTTSKYKHQTLTSRSSLRDSKSKSSSSSVLDANSIEIFTISDSVSPDTPCPQELDENDENCQIQSSLLLIQSDKLISSDSIQNDNSPHNRSLISSRSSSVSIITNDFSSNESLCSLNDNSCDDHESESSSNSFERSSLSSGTESRTMIRVIGNRDRILEERRLLTLNEFIWKRYTAISTILCLFVVIFVVVLVFIYSIITPGNGIILAIHRTTINTTRVRDSPYPPRWVSTSPPLKGPFLVRTKFQTNSIENITISPEISLPPDYIIPLWVAPSNNITVPISARTNPPMTMGRTNLFSQTLKNIYKTSNTTVSFFSPTSSTTQLFITSSQKMTTVTTAEVGTTNLTTFSTFSSYSSLKETTVDAHISQSQSNNDINSLTKDYSKFKSSIEDSQELTSTFLNPTETILEDTFPTENTVFSTSTILKKSQNNEAKNITDLQKTILKLLDQMIEHSDYP